MTPAALIVAGFSVQRRDPGVRYFTLESVVLGRGSFVGGGEVWQQPGMSHTGIGEGCGMVQGHVFAQLPQVERGAFGSPSGLGQGCGLGLGLGEGPGAGDAYRCGSSGHDIVETRVCLEVGKSLEPRRERMKCPKIIPGPKSRRASLYELQPGDTFVVPGEDSVQLLLTGPLSRPLGHLPVAALDSGLVRYLPRGSTVAPVSMEADTVSDDW